MGSVAYEPEGTNLIDILSEPTGEKYRLLLAGLSKFCPGFLLVVRDEIPLNPRGTSILAELAGFLRGKERSTRWPGTELLSGEATVYTFELNEETLHILATRVQGLYEWKQPENPEDLCLLLENGSPLLVTISHEGDSFVAANEQIESACRLLLDRCGIEYS